MRAPSRRFGLYIEWDREWDHRLGCVCACVHAWVCVCVCVCEIKGRNFFCSVLNLEVTRACEGVDEDVMEEW